MKPFHFTKPQPKPQVRNLCVYNTMEDGTIKECNIRIQKTLGRIVMFTQAGLIFEWTPEQYTIQSLGSDFGFFDDFVLVRKSNGQITQTGHPEWWNCDDLENEWSYEQALSDFDNLSDHDYMMKQFCLGRCYQG